MDNKIGAVIRDLRLSRGLTQKELAAALDISLSSIKSYENSYREPNSKAMVALENYFKVSGDFLIGNLSKDVFINNYETIQSDADILHEQYISFKRAFSSVSQDKQKMALAFVRRSLETATEDILLSPILDNVHNDDFAQLLSVFSRLNQTGKVELIKRAQELSQLSQYK